MALPEYIPFVERLGSIMEGVHLHHFLPTPSPPSVLGTAPVIEFATFYDAAPDFKSSLEKFIKAVDNPEGTAGHAYGETLEEVSKHADGEEGKKAKAVVLTIGWESVDAHMKFRETEKFKSNVGLIRGNHGGAEMVSLLNVGGKGRLLMPGSSMLRSRLYKSNSCGTCYERSRELK